MNILRTLLIVPFLTGCGAMQGNTATVVAMDDWRAQLALADQKAKAIEASAVLWHVLATPARELTVGWDPNADPLLLHFDYLKSDHNQLRITLWDSDPQGTLVVEEVTNSDSKLLRPALRPDELEASINTVAVGPREAIRAALTYLTKEGTGLPEGQPLATLELGEIPAKWYVQFIGRETVIPSFGEASTIAIDAQTGAIIKVASPTSTPE
jgi:hypothetical protein